MRNGLTYLLTGSLLAVSSLTVADGLYEVQVSQLVGKTLFDQSVKGRSMVTVKPVVSESAKGDVSALNQCLWSVDIRLDGGAKEFVPGKMICVGPKQEVLEAVPVGTIEAFGDCTNDACDQMMVKGQTDVLMSLDEPLSFSIQPRNERK